VLVGVMYIALGTLRLGFLTNFLSHSVISGFTTGAAVVIGVSQVHAISSVTRFSPDNRVRAGRDA
jgi:MFS superfamily sulfate permease-like transporter